mgnify:CR=1 FL=1
MVKGVNGSGKSTFLRLLTGLIHPPVKGLFWEGEELKRQNLLLYQQNLLYVGHKLCLHHDALLNDQLCLWQGLYNISKASLEYALQIWGVAAFKNKKISHLSQGQQKRLSLSRCSWLNRSLWILDEPHVGLDLEGKVTLDHILNHHQQKNGLVILATHDPVSTSKEIIL